MASLNIRQRGATWQIRVRHQGRDHYRYSTTEAEARSEGARFVAELASRGAPPASAATSFAAWADSWMTLAAPGLAPATAARYRELLDLHVLPALGNRRIGSLTAGHGLDLQRTMLERGLSPVTVWSALRLAKAITAEAEQAQDDSDGAVPPPAAESRLPVADVTPDPPGTAFDA